MTRQAIVTLNESLTNEHLRHIRYAYMRVATPTSGIGVLNGDHHFGPEWHVAVGICFLGSPPLSTVAHRTSEFRLIMVDGLMNLRHEADRDTHLTRRDAHVTRHAAIGRL